MIKKTFKIRMRTKPPTHYRGGVALLMVLFLIMVITVFAAGFMSRSDTELACGQNMLLRGQMDYLAESGLEHAKGLILNPQDVDFGGGEFWTGASRQQLAAGNDYYDVTVQKLGSGSTAACNYTITSTAYREKSGEVVGTSGLRAELRIDPYIAYWQTSLQSIPSQVTINGDVYCRNSVTLWGTVRGDTYSMGTILGGGTGQEYSFVAAPPVNVPGISCADFSSQYYIGSTLYTVSTLSSDTLQNVTLGPTASNPAGIYYRNGNLELRGGVQINGTLVVTDDLKVYSAGNVITAVKNFPALLVGYDLRIENNTAALSVTGYSQVSHHIDMNNEFGSVARFTGALFVFGDGIKNCFGASVTITAEPMKAAIQLWPTSGVPLRWSPAGGAFYKSIARQ